MVLLAKEYFCHRKASQNSTPLFLSPATLCVKTKSDIVVHIVFCYSNLPREFHDVGIADGSLSSCFKCFSVITCLLIYIWELLI